MIEHLDNIRNWATKQKSLRGKIAVDELLIKIDFIENSLKFNFDDDLFKNSTKTIIQSWLCIQETLIRKMRENETFRNNIYSLSLLETLNKEIKNIIK